MEKSDTASLRVLDKRDFRGNVDKAIEDFGKVLDSLDDVSKHLLNAADTDGIKQDFEYCQNALTKCKRMSRLKGTSPTSFVAAISKSLREKPAFLALLDVNYESDCTVNFMISDFMKKQNGDVAVMLPDDFLRPYLRYKITDQIARHTGNLPWIIKMVSASKIEDWIAFNSAHRLLSFAEKINSLPNAFPNGDIITIYFKEAIDAMTTDDFEREAFGASLEESDGNIIGTTTTKALKDQLVGTIFVRITECIANKVAVKTSGYMLDKLRSTLKLDIEEHRDLVPKETFQTFIVLYVQRVIVASFLVNGPSIFGLSLYEARLLTTKAKAEAFESSFPVDINSESWRRKIAWDAFVVFNGERENLKENVCRIATSEISKMFKESSTALMKSHKDIYDVGTKLGETNRVHTVETFSNKDFEKMTDISSFAKKYGKNHSCLECTGCVGVMDQFECIIRGEKRRLEGGSAVVVTLHDEINDESHEGDFPLVKLSIQRQNEEQDRIFRFQEQHDLQYIDDEIYKEKRNKLDNELLRSFSKKHSNLVAIDICTTKSRNGGKDIEACTCIVICCFAKGFIPIGENIFPREIRGIPTDVREAYALPFGTRDFNNPIGPGCSVGLKDSMSSGSIGFLLQHRDDGHFAFVSSAHVFFDFSTLRKYADGDEDLKLKEYKVVQPSDADNSDNESMVPVTDRICGHVESIHFNSTKDENCKDLIVVASEKSRHPILNLRHPSIFETSKQQSGCHIWPDGYNINDIEIQEGSIERSVLKVGRTTDLTTGHYAGQVPWTHFRVNNISYDFYDMLKIRGYSHEDFAQNGDSGAGIYLRLENTLKPFAILEGSKMKHETLAIPASVIKTFCPRYDIQTFERTNFRDDNEEGDAVKSEILYKRADKNE